MGEITEKCSETLGLRLTSATMQKLQAAAVAANQSVDEFVLEGAITRAEQPLPGRHWFGLNAEQWAEFQAALDAPPQPAPGLDELLRNPSVFEI